MDLGINWYQIISVENYGVSFFFSVLLLVVTFIFAKRWVSRITGVAASLAYLTLSVQSSASIGEENIQFLNDRAADLQQSAEQFSLPVRKEISYLANEISKAQKDEFYYIGNLRRSDQSLILTQLSFMTKEETAVYKKFLSHCYSDDIVNTVWSDKLSGYPILSHEAQQALAYAEARSEQIKPECLGTTASLSFLK